ncbi:MAG: hypothetical protein U1E89_06695 [Burkholderiaceae bacterium]
MVGIDGLKIEPLDEAVNGVRADGTRACRSCRSTTYARCTNRSASG